MPATTLPDNHKWKWSDVLVMGSVTVILAITALVAAPQFERIYKELGLALPELALLAMRPWFHVVVLLTLAIVCVWRQWGRKPRWATAIWSVLALGYVGFVTWVLVVPLVGVIEK